MSSLKVDADSQRDVLIKHINSARIKSVKQNAIVDGLYGLADTSYKAR